MLGPLQDFGCGLARPGARRADLSFTCLTRAELPPEGNCTSGGRSQAPGVVPRASATGGLTLNAAPCSLFYPVHLCRASVSNTGSPAVLCGSPCNGFNSKWRETLPQPFGGKLLSVWCLQGPGAGQRRRGPLGPSFLLRMQEMSLETHRNVAEACLRRLEKRPCEQALSQQIWMTLYPEAGGARGS